MYFIPIFNVLDLYINYFYFCNNKTIPLTIFTNAQS